MPNEKTMFSHRSSSCLIWGSPDANSGQAEVSFVALGLGVEGRVPSEGVLERERFREVTAVDDIISLQMVK